MKTDLERLQAAFAELEKQDIVAKANFMCCQNCAQSVLRAEWEDNYVFWHAQDDEMAFGRDVEFVPVERENLPDLDPVEYAEFPGEMPVYAEKRNSDDLQDDLYLSYGNLTVGKKVCKALRKQGLEAEWNGDIADRILVKHPA